ncbi:hypothetical protein FTO74_12440 [Granulicella sp. WH15]|uniref:hypothetical protein n=1 Tax=Granulicella sp. WH15 TaxID=2602070 RepID=UPI0013668C2B|nr:hypothetical protein [Granulicella sp. WH15]QHN04090.1 hypothetical protein FTO74_12440 [Granulicella sp. WH15]
MRFRVVLVFALLASSLPVSAAVKPEDAIDHPALLAQLEDEARTARPREQCYLYTQIVHIMTEIAGRRLAEGETEEAAAVLKQVQHYAELIHLALARDTRRLRETEMLMQTTTHRLGQCLHLASSDDRPALQATLAQLDRVNEELLTQVFQH